MSTQCASPNNKVDHNKDKDVNSDNSSSQKLSSSDSDSSEFGLGLKSGHPEDNFSKNHSFCQKNNETPIGKKKLFTDKSVHNDKSLFVKNWVNLGGAFNKATLNFPEFYPNGCVQYEIKKGKGKIPKNPRIGWANISKKGKYKCMGGFACPKFGKDNCFFL